MPDPILYLKASIAVVFASTLVVLALRLIIGKSARSFAGGVGVLGIGAGLLVGYTVLQFAWTWPPANGLNRLLLIVLPAAAMLEFLAAVFAAPDRVFAPNVSPQIATHGAPKGASGTDFSSPAARGRLKTDPVSRRWTHSAA
jgi:hypothetical protein